ncbi:MAG: hypothetical protein RLZZ165_1753, partial [Bacteroidota bacterium]
MLYVRVGLSRKIRIWEPENARVKDLPRMANPMVVESYKKRGNPGFRVPVTYRFSLQKTRLMLLVLLMGLRLTAQDTVLTRARIFAQDLASPSMHGRGYQNDGHKIAADYIAAHFESFGLLPVPSPADPSQPYFQPVRFSLNLVEGEQSLTIDGKPLQIGRDYIIH